MPLRIFTDSAGQEWMVWSVEATSSHVPERRKAPDRRVKSTANYTPERRVVPDRRKGHFSGSDVEWLCFETDSEKRCLAPVPPDWKGYSKQEMEALCKQAHPVTRRC